MAADNPEGILYSEEVWNYFIALLLKSRLATVRDVERIETVKPSFPLTFETFVNTIQQEFGDHSLKQLNMNLDDTKEQLENCRTLINMMNIRFLQRTELKQLATLIYQSNQKGVESSEAVQKIYRDIKGYSEDVFGFVWDKIDGLDYKKIKLPHEVIQQEKASLEREYNSRRVRRVHYRK